MYGLTELKEAHLDLKPKNILIEIDRTKILTKIGDFGDSKTIKNLTDEAIGTPFYQAPEIFER